MGAKLWAPHYGCSKWAQGRLRTWSLSECRLNTNLQFRVWPGVHGSWPGTSAGGTKSDHVADGRRNVLFPFRRVSGALHLKPRYTVVLLCQSLDVRTQIRLVKPLVLGIDIFPAGTAMDLHYGFDF
jgi:hypothetical protein